MSFFTSIFKKKDEPIKNYADFWNWFQKNEKSFFQVVKRHDAIETEFFDKISPKLNELEEDVFFYLTGMFDENTAELILTPDGIIKNIVFVEELVALAPKIPSWKFTALKPALDIKDVSINMAGFVFDRDTLSFYSKENPSYPDEIDIVITYKNFSEEDRKNIISGVYIFLDNFLGELNAITTIDNISIIGESEAERDLIPIEKLKDFLIWREKEFLEKYEGEWHNTEQDNYTGIEAELKNGRAIVAMINTTLLEWDGKASHPWFMTVKINYNGDNNNGMPNRDAYSLMDNFENEIMSELKDSEGYLNIGHETGDNLREIYFACKDFRKSSKVLHGLRKKYAEKLDVSYDIYKEKYWKTMERYRNV